MSGYTIIYDIGQTLVELLKNNWPTESGLINEEKIRLGYPEDKPNETQLYLHLFRVAENPYIVQEQNRLLQQNGPGQIKKPLYLDLYYLMFVCSDDLKENETMREHKSLGRAMQIFNDHRVLSGSILKENLENTEEMLQLILHPLSFDDLSKIWSNSPRLFRSAIVCYMVTAPAIDSEQREVDASPVISGQIDLNKITGESE